MRIYTLTAAIWLISASAFAAVAGDWSGDLNFPNGRLRFILHVSGPDNDLRATADSPDQEATNLPVDSIRLDGDTLTFRMTQLNVRFSGREARSEIRGTFTQNGVDVALALVRKSADKSGTGNGAKSTSEISGDWQGVLNFPGQTLRFALHITGSDEDLRATADTPDQNVSRLPVDSIIRDGQRLHFTISSLNVRYSGTMVAGEIRGTFSQSGRDVALSLRRSAR